MNKYGLLGKKLSHSYSKLIHEYLFKQNAINATYCLLEIGEEELPIYIEKLRNKEFIGFNVTIPYKEKIIPYLDCLTDAAKNINAVNTVYLDGTTVVGDNTDYLGFIEELEYYNLNVKNKNVYVLGTGGASKAICYGLSLLNSHIHLVSRDIKKGLTYTEFEKIENIDAIINTTPVGMYPKVGESIISKEIACKASFIVDLIFNPEKTLLLSYTKNGYNGLIMLIFQAIHAEKRWLGKIINYDLDAIIAYLKDVI